MATGKTASSSSSSQKDFWAQQTKLWQQPVDAWNAFLSDPKVGADKVFVTGTRIKLCCPYHTDNNPSGHIHTVKGYYKCFAESCRQSVKDPIKLVQKLMNVSYTEAFDTFRRHFNLSRTIKPDDVKALDDEAALRRRMNLISDVCWSYLCNVWTANSLPETAKITRDWLRKTRGIQDVIGMTALGMLPRKHDLERLCAERHASAEDIKWILRFLNDYLGTGYMDCVVYTYASGPDNITAFKLRKPGPDKDDVRVVRLHDHEPLGCFGLTHSAYSPLVWSDKIDNVILVEGEHDQLTAYQGQYLKGVFDEIFLALGGGGHQGIDFLARIGLTKASIVGDHDDAGYEYPVHILKKSSKVSCKVFNWPVKLQNPTGDKYDPDESIRFWGFDSFLKEVIDPKNYSYAARWCYQRAQTLLVDVNEDDVVEQENVVTEIATLLRNDTELRSFAELICKDYPLLTPAKIRLSAAKYDDTPVGFIQSIAEWIKQNFHVISIDNTNNILKLWHKARRTEVEILVGHRKGVTTFKALTPTGVLYEWVRDEIGLPSYLPDPEADDATHAALSKCEKDIAEAVDMAFSVLSSQAKENPWHLKGQGVHLTDVGSGEPGYLVNGKRIYKIVWSSSGTGFKEVTELDGPSDGNFIFDIKSDKIRDDVSEGWLPIITEAKDFFKKPKYTLHQCFEMVHDIIKTSCQFQHQDVDTTYVALLPFYSYVFDVMQKKSMTHIRGEFESGKSTALSMITYGTQMVEYALTYCATTLENYTPASLFQQFSTARVLIGLDEANDPGDGSGESVKMQTIYSRLRGLATRGIADYAVGTQDGQGKKYFLHTPVVTASATVIINSMDESRFNTLNLRKNPNMGNTRQMLLKKYGPKVFHDLRESIFLNVLRSAPLISQTYQSIYANFGYNSLSGFHRRHENLIPLVAVAKVIGIDGDKFISDYDASRHDLHVERAATSPGNTLVDSLLNSPFVQIGSDDVPLKKSLRSILQLKDLRDRINGSDTGIYFDEHSGCLGIVWPQVRQTLLVGSLSSYGRMSVASLKAQVGESQYFIRPEDAKKTGISMRLAANGMVGSSSISVLDVKHIMIAADDARTEFLASQPKVKKSKEKKDAEPVADVDNPLDDVDI